MQIKFENIILRDMTESDIEDYVRWFTVERECENWDAPWEKEDTDEEAERTSWREYERASRRCSPKACRLRAANSARHLGKLKSRAGSGAGFFDSISIWRLSDGVRKFSKYFLKYLDLKSGLGAIIMIVKSTAQEHVPK